MIDISKVFGTSSEPISGFFLRPGIGYYIPLYQREYSWDQENIDQLMEDICHGVDTLLDDDGTIRFMGTIILVTEHDVAQNIQPQDSRALPSRIDNVIDGQQRISTIALLSCLLYQTLVRYKYGLPKEQLYDSLREQIDGLNETLIELFSFDLKRGNPRRKPIIIRGSIDAWTLDKSDTDSYFSDVSSYIATVIKSITDEKDKPKFPSIPTGSLVGSNLRRIQKWLTDVEHAYDGEKDVFPPAWEILQKIDEIHIWSYSRPDLTGIVNNRSHPMTKTEKRVCTIVQLLAFAHFLLHRCCFTLIEPTKDNWAFDMFQSLNASGTPLTAVETFKPLVVNTVNAVSGAFKGSKSEVYFKSVDNLLGTLKSAAQKNRLTKEYLTTLALTYEGYKLSSQFSSQRKWLTDRYSKAESPLDKEEFVRHMHHLASYWINALAYDPASNPVIHGLETCSDADKKIAGLCLLYLQDAGHLMANTILSRFYSNIERGKYGACDDFVAATKIITAFFTLWRSAYPNTGLDDVYRTLLKEKISWIKGKDGISVDDLRAGLVKVLDEKGILDRYGWKNRANLYLRYDSAKVICKFALFVTAHDTIPDIDDPGLMRIGTPNCCPYYLDPNRWISSDLKTIEHVAPRRPLDGSDWDEALHQNDNVERVGNLTLLPVEINSSASNKGWIEKKLYYQHLAEKNPDKLKLLGKVAEDNGVALAADTLALLQSSTYNHHIEPLVIDENEIEWNLDFVDRRTNRICDIVWEKLTPWIT